MRGNYCRYALRVYVWVATELPYNKNTKFKSVHQNCVGPINKMLYTYRFVAMDGVRADL